MSNNIVCLMGPTASGKTDLACKLVTRYPLEIISVDSAMIYRGMDIGTAKPSKEELSQIPQHLIDIIDPVDTYSVAKFYADVSLLIDQIIAKGKIPLLVGGTMMYFNALQQGLSNLPDSNVEIRENIINKGLNLGWPEMHKKLAAVDALTAAKLHPHDAQRIGRALEVYELTGRRISEYLSSPKKGLNFNFLNISLFPQNRHWLHDLIAKRFSQMLQAGFIDEVSYLLEKWPTLCPEMPALRCVGYRQAYDYLQIHEDIDLLKEKAVAATRQLAKRQLTWLKNWSGLIYKFDPQDSKTKIIDQVGKMLDNVSC